MQRDFETRTQDLSKKTIHLFHRKQMSIWVKLNSSKMI